MDIQEAEGDARRGLGDRRSPASSLDRSLERKRAEAALTAAPHVRDVRIEADATAESARAYLERDRLLGAYALADLDRESIDRARWWVARREAEIVALVIVVESLPFRPCFVTGEPVAVGQLLREAMQEPRIIVAAPLSTRGAVESVYRFERSDTMYRMVLDESSFEPNGSHPVVRLDTERLDDVIDLYGNASRAYFTPERLSRELYFGVYAGGSLVSAAGTHVRSAAAGIAAVGNVLTRFAYRGRGMATACTSAVTSVALERHRDVVLNVRRDNTPAIAVYRRLGYRVHASFVEGPAIRRTGWERLRENIFGRNT